MEDTHSELPLMDDKEGNIVLFYPEVSESAIENVVLTLRSRWIGQGPKVNEFEKRFSSRFCSGRETIAVGSGTDALHLAYILAGIGEGDEVISPVFTCTATNIPLLYLRAKVVFADIQKETLNINPASIRNKITDRTKAIVCVHYGGLPCDMDEISMIAAENNIPVIEDAAHALGGTYNGKEIGSLSEFTMFSFQAIKHITTGDGGMLVLKDRNLAEKAKRIRWFGIDRSKKQLGIWENDITEIGYKYQMTDISAALGLPALKEFDSKLALRRSLFSVYKEELARVQGMEMVGSKEYKDREHAAWLCTVIVEDRHRLQDKLRRSGIESNQVHFRNDRYSIFRDKKENLPNMDSIEDKYLVLPLHTKITVDDVKRICGVIKKGW